jgi:enoyl-CoA hydratase
MIAAPDGIALDYSDDGILTCRFDRPHRRNALRRVDLESWSSVWRAVQDDVTVKAVILTGADPAFCAGGDIGDMTGELKAQDFAASPAVSRMWREMLAVPQPVIAAVNGDAVGVGMMLLTLCDFVVAAERARFGDPHVKIGLSAPGTGLFAANIGVLRTKQILMTGRMFSANDAYQMGLVTEVCPSGDDVLDRAREIAYELCALAPEALAWTKKCINVVLADSWMRSWDADCAFEALSGTTQSHAVAVSSRLGGSR